MNLQQKPLDKRCRFDGGLTDQINQLNLLRLNRYRADSLNDIVFQTIEDNSGNRADADFQKHEI